MHPLFITLLALFALLWLIGLGLFVWALATAEETPNDGDYLS